MSVHVPVCSCSGGLTYHFPEGPGGLGTVDCSGESTPRCNMSVNSAFLSGRSWYISQTKAYYGNSQIIYIAEILEVGRLHASEWI